MKRFVPFVLLILLASCSGPEPEPVRNVQPAAPLPGNDWRRQLVGAWTVEFRLDSVRRSGTVRNWRPGSFKTTSGSLIIRDSTAPGWGEAVQSSIDVEFDSLLGRPMSCYEPRPTATGIDRNGGQIRLTFTPMVADCGFSGYGEFLGDSIIGGWDESSLAGPPVMGRFRMVRKAN